MQVHLSDLDTRTFNRAIAQLDAAGIAYEAAAWKGGHKLTGTSDDAAQLRRFVSIALADPERRVMR